MRAKYNLWGKQWFLTGNFIERYLWQKKKLIRRIFLISKGKFPAACGEKNKVIPETIPRCLRRGVSFQK